MQVPVLRALLPVLRPQGNNPMEQPTKDTEALDAYSRAVTDVADLVGPAVVTISVTGSRPQRGRGGHQPSSGLGSGVIYSSDGRILTNEHVIRGATHIEVKLADGRVFTAGVAGASPQDDLAILRIGGRNLP